MWGHFLLEVGIIGDGWHSKRIQKILKKKNIKFLVYKPNNKKYFDKQKFEKLQKLNKIFIVSPNKSHLHYIKLLYKGRYIFCEKPPVSNENEIKKLRNINPNKIFFNYNYRFSQISAILREKEKLKLGKLIYANLISGQAFAKKNDYLKNWRSNKKKCPTGVFEMKSVHLIDLINYHFDIKHISEPILLNQSKKGTSPDTSHIKILTNNKANIDIFSSYFVPMIRKQIFIFDNGLIEQNDKNITIYGPALNQNKQGLIVKPKIIKKYFVSEKKDYDISLKKSISYFLHIAKKRGSFLKKDYLNSLKSNSLIFK